MAKKRRNAARGKRVANRPSQQVNEPQFFEAMGAAPSLSLLPGLPISQKELDEAPAPAAPLPNAAPASTGNQSAFIPVAPWPGHYELLRAGAADTWQGLQWAAKLLTGKAARRMYLVALSFSIIGAGVVAGEQALSTIQKYRGIIASPTAIVASKHTGTTITDRNGVVLYQAYGATDHPYVKLSDIPQNVKDATLATEDPHFYDHEGVSWRDTGRAIYQDIANGGKVQGGSTITQQLVKYNLLTSEKSFTRKFNEMALSIQMERTYSKDQIFEMYLNTIYYGQGAYGIESASQTYFHKSVKDLTLPEAALLVGLPQSPSRYDPNINPNAAFNRRDDVLQRMVAEKKITQAVADASKAQREATFTRNVVLRAPHFVFYVLNQLTEKYGAERVEQGGLTVKTSLDITKQEAAEQAVTAQIASLAGNHVTNGGLISLDPTTGDILAMVGSINYYEPTFGSVNVTLSALQPGSSIKPIAYSAAFARGWNGATVVQDRPLNIKMTDGTVYSPQNYDQTFRGPVTLRRALANSLNIPAVEVLQYVGLEGVEQQARNFGLTTVSTDPGRYGPSFVLGGVEARPIDMAAAYSVFARGGTTVEPRAIAEVKDKTGTLITKPEKSVSNQVLDPRHAYQITSILSDNEARKEEFGSNSPLVLSRTAAVKTGTTNDYKDNWTIGYTPDIVTAVWVGNNDHSAMNGVTGITGAAPIWRNYMEAVLAGTPVREFTPPSGLVLQQVCRSDGGLTPDANPSSAVGEWFLAEKQQTNQCGQNGPKGPTPQAQVQPQAQAATAPQPATPSAPLQSPQMPVGGSGSGPVGGAASPTAPRPEDPREGGGSTAPRP